MKEKAARLAIKRQQQAIRAAEVAKEKAQHEELVRCVPMGFHCLLYGSTDL